eukprot:TRINITY_DN16250_c0_g1_i2.p7 TRINITY_DN16250_c0_g1~~TRINITY_DN16250_c0_g1_i2.p7  ORF type:complete len:187 (-),score=-5.34 TRINITY_DN16250_c0_g1_i2:3275-3835(-)
MILDDKIQKFVRIKVFLRKRMYYKFFGGFLLFLGGQCVSLFFFQFLLLHLQIIQVTDHNYLTSLRYSFFFSSQNKNIGRKQLLSNNLYFYKFKMTCFFLRGFFAQFLYAIILGITYIFLFQQILEIFFPILTLKKSCFTIMFCNFGYKCAGCITLQKIVYAQNLKAYWCQGCIKNLHNAGCIFESF